MEFYCTKVDGVLIGSTPEDQAILAEIGADTELVCKPKPKGIRTGLQNRAMHKYFELLAEELNNAGYTMEVVLKHHPRIQWTKESVKGHLWKPVLAGMTEDAENDVSTAEQTTVSVIDVYTELQNFISEKFGVNVEWPSKLSG